MKILITGAHFTPAFAVIEELNKFKNIEIVYVGRKTTLEGDKVISAESVVLPQLGVKFIPIVAGRLQRVLTIFTLPSLLKIPVGFFQACLIILSQKPDVILSFGGYVAVPVVFAGWLYSVPIVIHEQTLVSGLASKITACFANKIAVGFAENDLVKKRRVVVTGNPIRSEILNPSGLLTNDYERLFALAKRNNLPVILVTGGNQGSHIINQSIAGCLEALLQVSCVIHQTGDSSFKDSDRLMSKQSDRYIVKKFINKEMGTILSRVDLVISRAGINSLTEMALWHKPGLVIPISYQDEQVKNARYFKELGFVRVLNQSELNSDKLYGTVLSILKDLSKWHKKLVDIKINIDREAAKKVAIETIFLANP